LKSGRCRTQLQRLALGNDRQIPLSYQTFSRLIHAIPPNHALVIQISSIGNLLCQLCTCGHEMLLEVLLDVLAVNHALWREVFAGVEQGEDCLRCQMRVVGTPDHCRELTRLWIRRVWVFAMQERRVGHGEVARFEAACVERP
jgi:hypothetical protein